MQFLLTAKEMESCVKRSALVHSETVREALFKICQPETCIHLPGGKNRKCDDCPLSMRITIPDGTISIPHREKLCPLDQNFSK